ncbi:MAG TPA: serine/threonine-protein kinase [Solirubrobacterales bacterium]|nr:serine/threonine-protein kinase [Solirubrobacterales bacterium]
MAATIGTGELLKNRYRLERTLGRGGMAAVWLGHDEVLDRQVAVKVLADTIAADPGFVARFRREARTAAGLSHPNLVGVYDFSEEGERPYLVMQFVPGESLAALLERGEEVDCDKLAREMLDALVHIHGAGILHRDVKPGNIVVEPDGTAKLIDFGIARPLDATAMTRTGLIMATERFAAPEVMEGRPASERSDLYSLGVVLRACGGSCSRALGALVESLTETDPAARPSSARQALARLERAEPALEQTTEAFELTPLPESEAPAPPPPVYERRTGSRRSRWGALLALLAFLVAIGAIAAVALNGGGGDGGEPRQAKAGKAKKAKQAKQKGSGAAAASEPASSSPAPVEEPSESEPSESEQTEPAAAPESGSSADGASLNEQGFALIQAGEYEAAVPVLEEAVAAYPEGSEDLDYAYALFNLGNALRLSGRPEEAIPVLEKRLEIPNQTGTVEAELARAREEAG